MPRDVTIAPADAGDVAAVSAFGAEHVPPHYAPLIGEERARALVRDWWSPPYLGEAVGAGELLLAHDGDQLIGVAQWGLLGGDPVLWKLYVHPEHRGGGVGVQLLDAVISAIPSGSTRLLTEHVAGNERAAAFYAREGFEVVRVEDDPDGLDAAALVWRARPLVAGTGPTPDDDRTRAIRALWSAGDYARVGEPFEPAAQQVVDDLEVAGRRMLDAGTGTGNAALAAARAGAEVSAFDLTPGLLEIARARAAEEGLTIDWREGDLLDIPWADDTFDATMSVFAAFLADDPVRCLAELARVTRPGGVVVVTTWSERSIFVRMMRVAMQHDSDVVRAADAGPFGDHDRLRSLAAGTPIEQVALSEHELPLTFPSAEAALAEYEEISGPVQQLARAFGDRWRDVRADIADDWDGVALGRGRSTVELPATYVRATLRLRP
jgi:SAM-dependent methyltransferase/GNAT superfamily N-acetyltransferase